MVVNNEAMDPFEIRNIIIIQRFVAVVIAY